MKVKKVLKLSVLAVLFIALAGYVVYAMTSMTKPDPEEICRGVVLVIEDNGSADFVDKAKVESLLKAQNLYPVGRKCADIDTRTIEEALKRNPFIERVECYKASDGKFCINVFQANSVESFIRSYDGPFQRISGYVGAGAFRFANGNKER